MDRKTRYLLAALSYVLALLVAVSGGFGLWDEATYAHETALWAAQGIGQDVVNVFLVAPSLIVIASWMRRGSASAFSLWLGLLIYIAYSSVLYAFFVHFGKLFLVYVATLGLSIYLLLIGGSHLMRNGLVVKIRNRTRRRIGLYLIISSGVFAALWLKEIASAWISGTLPQSAAEIGARINPVHVLDLGILLPGMALAGMLLLQNRPAGFRWAPPLVLFSVVMGVAIVAMFGSMRLHGLPSPTGPIAFIATLVVLGTTYLVRYFIEVRAHEAPQ